MLSIQSASINYQNPTVTAGRSNKIADDLAPELTFFQPPRLAFDPADLVKTLKLAQEQAYFEQNRGGIAAILLLLHDMQLVSEAEIDQGIRAGWQAVYQLYAASLMRLEAKLTDEAMQIAGRVVDHRDYVPLEMMIFHDGIAWVLCITMYPRYSSLDISTLDRVFAGAIYGCLHWIVHHVGVGMLPEDLVENSWQMDEEMTEFKQLQDDHPDYDLAQLAEAAVNGDQSYFAGMYDDDDIESPVRISLARVMNESTESLFGSRLEMDRSDEC